MSNESNQNTLCIRQRFGREETVAELVGWSEVMLLHGEPESMQKKQYVTNCGGIALQVHGKHCLRNVVKKEAMHHVREDHVIPGVRDVND